jgi:hypothetical protein
LRLDSAAWIVADWWGIAFFYGKFIVVPLFSRQSATKNPSVEICLSKVAYWHTRKDMDVAGN